MASKTLDVRLNATDNMSPAFQKAGNAAEQLGSTLNGLGKKGGGFDGLLNQIKALDSEITSVGQAMVGMGAALTAALAVPMAAGTKAAFDQVRAVQQATVALSAYEKDASKVNQVLQDLVAYARSDLGVLFQREDLFAAAQGLKVMGAETENLVEYVEIMSRAVGLGTVTWDELGMVIGRVLATGKLAGNEFDELTKAGYQLDPALRNAAVSADELFDALGRGIPADAMLGQVDTIDGQLVRFRSSIRELGLAILQVDRDTSEFVEGGLGDRLVNGIGQAREVMLSLQPAAASVGDALAVAAGGVSAAVDIFLALPQPVQTAIAAMTGLSGIALTAGGAMLLIVPRVAETAQAFISLGRAIRAAGIASNIARFTLFGAALTGVAIAGGILLNSWMDQRQAAAEYESTLTSLDQTLENIRRQGDAVLAARGRVVEQLILDAQAYSDTLKDAESFFDEDLPHPNDPDFSNFVAEYEAAKEAAGGLRVDAELTTQAVDALNSILSDPRVDHDAYLRYTQAQLEAAQATKDTTDDVEALNQIIADQNEMPTEFLTAYIDELANLEAALDTTDQAWRDWQEGMGPFDTSPAVNVVEWEEFTKQVEENTEAQIEAQRKLAEEQQKAREEWIASALAIGQYDNALSQLNMTGMTGDVGMFAEEWTRANQAMENSFRIIVGNTNAIIQQVDGIQSWADSLINVRGELGEIDNLLEGGFIDETIYTNAQNAYDRISVSTGNIRGNLLAVQAIQAPWIAEVVAGTERWAAELRQMPEEVQRTTLAFMDLQTVTQAQELITLGNSAAFREMGDEGKAAFEATIQGALQVNPLLFDVLKTMGIISGTPLDFEVNYDALSEAGSAMDQLITSVDNLVDTLRQIYKLPPLKPEVDMSEVEAAASPGGPLGLLKAGFDNLRDEPVDIPVNVHLGSAAVGDGTGGAPFTGISDIAAMLGLPPEGAAITQTVNIETTGTEEIATAKEAIDGITDKSVTVSIDVDSTAVGDLMTLIGSINEASAAKITVDVVIGTNELDTGLAQFGIGTGGGGGPAGYTAPSVTVNVEADASDAIAQLEGVAGAAAAADALSVTIPAGAPGAEDASQKLEYLAGRAAAADALSVTIPVDTPGSAAGIDQLQGVAGAAAAADAMSVTIPVSVSGAYTAIAQLNDVANAAANANRTVTITTYHRTVGIGVTAQHGGIPSYATGGVLFRGAEGNRPELAHFANGGTALLPRDGLYMAPPMTYISPSNTQSWDQRTVSGDTYELHIHGNVYGIDDLAEAFEGAVSRRRRAYGLEANA